ncbi:uncharacterized protein J4E79_009390 [Alternaria viburni]|uniref:uncharacterized protein n=1 Tax=Alternaria viburni TaxID=566460 RepID=UPI0020C53DD0|nr:uncharacterized protein J4E79_009390 [Alternaria viburni]KAI4651191.1 hypothetical protein J4E79_009390 [Alternaria viburni]
MASTPYAAPLDGPAPGLYENTTVVADTEVNVTSTKYVWSGLGDSWASGVSYGFFGTTDYDGNMDHCLRINHAYAPQMSRDNSWIPEGREQEFHFQSCSGTRWRQIDAEPHLGHIQLNDVPDNVDMIVLQAGGNNANFARVAYACIFAPQGTDYGPEYPDPNGQCFKELEATKQYILGTGRDQLFQDARWIVNQVFDHPKVKKNPKFRLFVVGYFQFFFDEGGEGDWCSNVSFGLRSSDRPRLSLALRKRINALIRYLNKAIEDAVKGSFHPERTTFVDTDQHLEGHRFCQPGHTLYDQYFGDNVYLWNMSPSGIFSWQGEMVGGIDDGDGNAEEGRQPTQAEFEHWLETGRFTDDPREIEFNLTAALHSGNDVTVADDPDNLQWLDMIGPYQQNYPGLTLRPFHPTESGYREMAKAIMAKVKEKLEIDYPPKPAPAPTPSKPKATHSIQILLAGYGASKWWQIYQGPLGVPVKLCVDDGRFKDAVIDEEKFEKDMYQNDANIHDPPYVTAGKKWPLKIDGEEDCSFESSANSPGFLKCGGGLELDFAADPQKGDKTVTCGAVQGRLDNVRLHRAWYVEY